MGRKWFPPVNAQSRFISTCSHNKSHLFTAVWGQDCTQRSSVPETGVWFIESKNRFFYSGMAWMLLEADGSCIMTVTVTFLDQKKKKKVFSISVFLTLSLSLSSITSVCHNEASLVSKSLAAVVPQTKGGFFLTFPVQDLIKLAGWSGAVNAQQRSFVIENQHLDREQPKRSRNRPTEKSVE